MKEVWADANVEEGNLNRTISSVRKALGEERGENRYIETVPKIGYRFVGKIGAVNETAWGEKAPKVEDSGGRKYLIWGIAAVLLLTISAGGVVYFRNRARGAAKIEPAAPDAPIRLTETQVDEDSAEWTRDGKIRFARFIDSRTAASFVMNDDGSDQRKANDQIPSLMTGTWSPDGKKVLFRKMGENPSNAYLANSDGSNEMKLRFSPGNMDWSSDSKRIVYQSNEADRRNTELFIFDLESSKITNITNSSTFEADPAFSPDGKSIAFVSDRDGNQEIYLMKDDGTGVRRLTDNPARDAFPTFSPDGTQIVFDSNRENENVDVYLMNVNDDSRPVKLTDWQGNEEHRRNCWSPDGTRIVFTSDISGKNNIYVTGVEAFKTDLVFADAAADIQPGSFSPGDEKMVYQAKTDTGKGEIRVLDLRGKVSKTVLRTENTDLIPRWSPIGDLIAYNCRVDGNTDICTIKPDGTGMTDLTDNEAHDSNAIWSPDGSELVFSSDRERRFDQFQLFRMNADGSEQTRVTRKNGYEMTPACSPDGSLIAFAGDRQDGTSQSLDIFLIGADNPGNEKVILHRPGHDTQPAFSPDGRRIAFVSQADGNYEIYLVNIDGSGLVRLTRNPAEDTAPRFGRDGTKLVFSSNRGGKFALYEIALPQ